MRWAICHALGVVKPHPSPCETYRLTAIRRLLKPEGIGVVVRQQNCLLHVTRGNVPEKLIHERPNDASRVRRIKPDVACPFLDQPIGFNRVPRCSLDGLLGEVARAGVHVNRSHDAACRFDVLGWRVPLDFPGQVVRTMDEWLATSHPARVEQLRLGTRRHRAVSRCQAPRAGRKRSAQECSAFLLSQFRGLESNQQGRAYGARGGPSSPRNAC